MLALVIDLLRWVIEAFPDAPDVMQCRGVVLIDELDAHAHPAWQRQIGHWLRAKFPNLQFLIATHSPFLAQVGDAGGNVVLERHDEEVRVSPRSESVRTWRADQILTELFELESTRSPDVERNVKRLLALYRKRAQPLTSAESREYEQLLLWSEALPPGVEGPAERELIERIKKAVARESHRIRELG
jgi:hypothetical protein